VETILPKFSTYAETQSNTVQQRIRTSHLSVANLKTYYHDIICCRENTLSSLKQYDAIFGRAT